MALHRLPLNQSPREKHQITIHARGKSIQGSPFDLQVTSGIDCTKIGPVLLRFTPNSDDAMTIHEPWGVADPNGLYVVSDHHNHHIHIYFDTNGRLLHQFGTRGKADGQIWCPAGVCMSESGHIFVADPATINSSFLQTMASSLKFGSKGTGLGQLKGPCGLALDSNGRVIVAERDNHRIHIFDSEGQRLCIFWRVRRWRSKFNCPTYRRRSKRRHFCVGCWKF
ncbi:unnamed protein product [Porites lobata]|uniref:NHL repeat-containing protein n=1 Tax=Porites lobata TaxID=104759 RepID=A0ABN8SEY1_9CNID|nr:unnamed protein product [Porites lobata]